MGNGNDQTAPDDITPIQFALPYVHSAGVNAHLDNAAAMYEIINQDPILSVAFSDGWMTGIEGHGYNPVEGDTGSKMSLEPFVSLSHESFRANQVWLFGYLAGRYAATNNWSTPTLRDDDDSEEPILGNQQAHKSH